MATSLHLASGGKILDENSNELLEFAQTPSAQNHIKITNKGTGNGPVIQAVGSDDTNVSLNLLGKGAGSLTFNNTFTVSSTGNLDVPGTLDVIGATTLTGALAANGGISVDTNKFTVVDGTGATTISNDTDGEFVALTLVNQSDASDTSGIVSLRFDLEDSSGTAVNAGKIAIKKNETFTSTGTTQNSNMVFSTSFEGALTEYMTLTSTGALNLAGALNVTGNSTLTGYFTLGGNLSNITTNAEKMKIDSATLTTVDSTVIASIAGLRIAAPTITLGNSSTVTTGASLYVAGAPTGATSNYAAYLGGDTYIECDTTSTALQVTQIGAGSGISVTSNIGAALATTGAVNITGATTITGALTTTSTTKFGDYTYTWPSAGVGTLGEFLKISSVDNNLYTITLDWDSSGGGGVTTLDDLTDVVTSDSQANFTNSIVIATDNTAPTLGGALSNAENNIGIGNQTFDALISGTKNIIVGNASGATLTTGLQNIAIGHNCIGTSATTASRNIIVGSNSFSLASTASDNVVIGDTAGTSMTTGSNNTLVGKSSGTQITIVSSGTLDAVGNSSTVFTLETGKSSNDDFYNGYTITFTSGANNGESKTISDYVGTSRTVTVSSAFTATPSQNDTYNIKAGEALTTGGYNTLIGSNSTCVATSDNQTSVGYLAVCSGANQVTLGNTSITALRCADTTIASLSDSRDKTNISDSTYGIDFINTLRPVQYTWDRRNLQPGDSTSVYNGKTRVGFLAQELQDAMPNGENDVLDLVYEVDPNRLEAKYGNLIPILTKAIQDLSAANEALMTRVVALENA